MSEPTPVSTSATEMAIDSALAATAKRPRKGKGGGLRGPEGPAGWLFVSPMILILGLFLAIPIVMALWVSLTNWNGSVSPFGGGPGAKFIGVKNYTDLFAKDGLTRSNFMQSISNTFWYVLFVVPLQTVLALGLALLVNAKVLKARSFFRTAFYFPSVTSSIAISTVFLFIFSSTGVVNGLLKVIGVTGPNWFTDDRGLVHLLFNAVGVDNPGWGQHAILGRSLWDWLSGPSVAMCVIIILVVWTTSGTFMLMFIAALQDLPVEVDEAAALDGATGWQKLRGVTIPMIRPALFLVLTLGLIGTWQVFDQIYIMGKGAPNGTTLSPAFLSYQQGFGNFHYGSGAAMAFVVFLIIVVLTRVQRWVLTDKDERRPILGRRKGARA
ncbi:MAG: sugar ABC transporter permease [Nostocoides sp.]